MNNITKSGIRRPGNLGGHYPKKQCLVGERRRHTEER